jgi:hypothetical protein
MLLNKKASCSLILIASLPCLLLITGYLGAHIWLIKERKRLEHLCYIKALSSNAAFSNFLNFTEHQHNPKVKRLKKKKKYLKKLLHASIHPATRLTLQTQIKVINAQLRLLQSDWNLKKNVYREKTKSVYNVKPFPGLSPTGSIKHNLALLESSILQSIDYDRAHTYQLQKYLIDKILFSQKFNIDPPFLFQAQFPASITVQCKGGIKLWKKRWLSQLI